MAPRERRDSSWTVDGVESRLCEAECPADGRARTESVWDGEEDPQTSRQFILKAFLHFQEEAVIYPLASRGRCDIPAQPYCFLKESEIHNFFFFNEENYPLPLQVRGMRPHNTDLHKVLQLNTNHRFPRRQSKPSHSRPASAPPSASSTVRPPPTAPWRPLRLEFGNKFTHRRRPMARS